MAQRSREIGNSVSCITAGFLGQGQIMTKFVALAGSPVERSIDSRTSRQPTLLRGGMRTLSACPNIHITGQIIFTSAIKTFGFADEALWSSSADSYETAVEGVFADIGKAATGRAVLRAISRTSPRTMLVEPMMGTDGGMPNAFAKPVDKKAASRQGSDTGIRYTPAHWKPSAAHPSVTGMKFWHGPGTTPDELLLHEVFHGLRHMAGLRMTRNVPLQQGYDSFEEFYAILIANIYRSELKRPWLRHDHHGFMSLEAVGIDNQSEFYKHRLNKQHLNKLRRQQPSLFADLQGVKADFNPTTLVD
jgi:hypothetical protein